MGMPGFTAEAALETSGRSYRGRSVSHRSAMVPAIPFCGNCDEILDRCFANGFRPRALCRACLFGNCYSGVEDPTPGDPFDPLPGSGFPGR